MFQFEKRVAFHETDAMGVVHHSNYVRIFEEARVAWLREKHLTDIHTPIGPYTFAVVGLNIDYLKSARFDDLIRVYAQGRTRGIRIQFRYAIWLERTRAWLTTGTTDLVPLDKDLKVLRLPKSALEVFAEDAWKDDDARSWPPANPSTETSAAR